MIAIASMLMGALATGCRTVVIADVHASFVFDLEVIDEEGQPMAPYRLGFADISLGPHQSSEPGWEVVTVGHFSDPGPIRHEFDYGWSEEWIRGQPPQKQSQEPEFLVSIEAPEHERWSRRLALGELERDEEGRYLVRLGRVRLRSLP